MKKIFKIKHICLLLILTFLFSLLTSCKIRNKYITYPDGYDIKVAEELEPHLLSPTTEPVLHFDMKNVNVSTTSTNYQLILVSNDFELVSDAFGKHLSTYAKNYIILEDSPQTNEDKEAKFGSTTKKLDDVDEFGNKQEYSREIRMVAWNDDGTRYSYQFRTFVSNKKRYYAFCYSTQLTIALEQSMMVVKIDGKNKLVMTPLPYDTKYEVSGSNLKIDALIDKDTYLDEKFNTYLYPNSLSNLTKEEKIIQIKEWYQNYCNGHELDDQFIIEYLGVRFIVDFNATKEDGMTGEKIEAFSLRYLELL